MAQSVKNTPVMQETASNAGDLGSLLGSGRSPGEGKGNPLQYSCLRNPTDREAWQATVHGVTRVGHDLATKPPPPIKHSQGPLAPSQGLWKIFWVISRELVCRHWNLHQVDEVNYMVSRLYSWHKLPQFEELASKKWKLTVELKINCT